MRWCPDHTNTGRGQQPSTRHGMVQVVTPGYGGILPSESLLIELWDFVSIHTDTDVDLSGDDFCRRQERRMPLLTKHPDRTHAKLQVEATLYREL
jgi:hypothetical protein